jgi:hypothetical protein
MSAKYGRNSFLYLSVDCHNHGHAGFYPLKSGIVFLFEFPIDFVDCKDDSVCHGPVELGPRLTEIRLAGSSGKDRERRLSQCCRPSFFLAHQFGPSVVSLDLRKVFDSDPEVVRNVARRDVLTVEVLDNKCCEKRPGA